MYSHAEDCIFDPISGIPKSEQPSLRDKILYQINYVEIRNGQPIHKFVEHPYYLGYVFNRLLRQKTLEESRLFL